MIETEIEAHLVWTVAVMGGGTYKFKSITNRGVADRIVCLPNGKTWFIEVKTETGKISSLQKVFAGYADAQAKLRLSLEHRRNRPVESGTGVRRRRACTGG